MKHAREDYNRIQDPEHHIPTEEPVFLLRAQDLCAAPVVRMWADLADAHGANDLAHMAREQARRMEQWPVKKIPDA